MRQYLDVKRAHRDALVAFRMGDFYELFYEDAVAAARVLELTLTSRAKDASGAAVAQMMNVGSFAEQVLVHHSQIAVMPKDVSFSVASLLGCGVITGAGAVLNTARVPAGSTVAVFGCGGVGNAAASTHGRGGRHPLMHRTETLDYAVVLEGEITMLLDDSEVNLKAGDVVIQRGTNHAWANRSGKPCRMLFVLIDGAFDPNISQHFSRIAH